MEPAGVIRTFLLVDIVAMSVLSLCYLRQRRLSNLSFWGWGLLALLVPVLGPFLVIANRPGEWDPEFSIRKDLVRVGVYLRRLLPVPSEPETRLERARRRYKNSARARSRIAGGEDRFIRGLEAFFQEIRSARGAVQTEQRKKKGGSASVDHASADRRPPARQK